MSTPGAANTGTVNTGTVNTGAGNSEQFRPVFGLPILVLSGMQLLVVLDGTVADPTRRDRETEAAREADAFVDTLALDEAAIARLPLDGGLTLLTKRR